MFFQPILPIDEQSRIFIEKAFDEFDELFGSFRFKMRKMIMPTQEFFPITNISNSSDLYFVYEQICSFMDIDPLTIQTTLDEYDPALTNRPLSEGHFEKHSAAGSFSKGTLSELDRIRVAHDYGNPMGQIATIAHELSHVKLARASEKYTSDPDLELYTDLFTIYSGFGLFTSLSAFQYVGYSYGILEGWQTKSLGYLSLKAIGFALALYAFRRDNIKPEWRKQIPTSTFQYYKQSMSWLKWRKRKGGSIVNRAESTKEKPPIRSFHLKWRGSFACPCDELSQPVGVSFLETGNDFGLNSRSIKWEPGKRIGIVFIPYSEDKISSHRIIESISLLDDLSEEVKDVSLSQGREIHSDNMQMLSCRIGEFPCLSPGVYRFKVEDTSYRSLYRDIEITR